jgi:sigma-B regulation protein RsbU (phosphoserine phosphatase)
VAFGSWRGGGIRQPWIRNATSLIIAVLAIVQMEGGGGFSVVLGIASVLPTFYRAGSFEVSTQSTLFSVLGTMLALLSLRRLIADRVEKQRLSGEIEAARVVQQVLLRKPDSTLIDAVYRPAAEVGGDFWQAFALEDGGHLLAVGDVSGKGLRAAMVVAVITGALSNRRSDEPDAILAELGRSISGRLDGGFVTACAARIWPDGRVLLANAGHLAPYLDGMEVDMDSGLPLGVITDAAYATRELRLAAGQQLTFVSDGVVEAANPRGELFGFDRTRNISIKPAQEVAEAARAWGQNDDITVVTVRLS